MSPFRDSAAGVLQVRPEMGLFLNANGGAYASSPDHADLDIVGDIDLRWVGALNDYTLVTTGNVRGLLTKYRSTGDQRSYYFGINSGGSPFLIWSADGTSSVTTKTASAALGSVGVTDLSLIAVRATLDVDNGSTQSVARFYYKVTTARTAHADALSNSGWTQLGVDQTTAGVASIFNGTAALFVSGKADDTEHIEGRILAAVIKNGIDGTTVFSADFTKQAPGTRSFVEGTGKTVTVNGAAFIDRYETGGTLRSLKNPGAATADSVSTPDHADLDITGDLDLRWAGALDDWTPSTTNAVLSKYSNTGNQRGYLLQVIATGVLNLVLSADGTAVVSATSSTGPTVTDGAHLAIRATWRASDGRVQFFTKATTAATAAADVASNAGWTQLGTDQTIAIASIFSNSSALYITGHTENAANRLAGRTLAAVVKSGIDGTTVADPNFNRPIGETSFVDGTGKTWTVGGNTRYTYESAA